MVRLRTQAKHGGARDAHAHEATLATLVPASYREPVLKGDCGDRYIGDCETGTVSALGKEPEMAPRMQGNTSQSIDLAIIS